MRRCLVFSDWVIDNTVLLCSCCPLLQGANYRHWLLCFPVTKEVLITVFTLKSEMCVRCSSEEILSQRYLRTTKGRRALKGPFSRCRCQGFDSLMRHDMNVLSPWWNASFGEEGWLQLNPSEDFRAFSMFFLLLLHFFHACLMIVDREIQMKLWWGKEKKQWGKTAWKR